MYALFLSYHVLCNRPVIHASVEFSHNSCHYQCTVFEFEFSFNETFTISYIIITIVFHLEH